MLRRVGLFEGIADGELNGMLRCIGAAERRYQKDEFILHAGDDVPGVGIVLHGGVQVIKEDFEARRTIMANLGPGDLFQEAFACAGIKKSPVAVLAAADAGVLFIDCGRIVTVCGNACAYHARLIRNMLRLLADKNLALNRKVDYLLIRSLRGKLAAYLLEHSGGGAQVGIPFDRGGLADYLSADRSALSRELGRMRAEGIIDFYKNSFKINDRAALAGCIR